MGRSWRRRCEQLEKMRQSLIILHGEIRYAGAELPEAIEQAAGRLETPFSEFYFYLAEKMRQMEGKSLKILWQTGMEKYLKNTYLTKDDRQIFLNLGGKLGYLDREMQLSSIESGLTQLSECIEELQKSMVQKQKLSVSLGLLSGFFLMVLLI